jgi:hypothetical protein
MKRPDPTDRHTPRTGRREPVGGDLSVGDTRMVPPPTDPYRGEGEDATSARAGCPAVLFVGVLWTLVANVRRRALLADSLPRRDYSVNGA